MEIPTSGAFLVMTHDHALDQAAIEWALRRGFAFVGGVGSRAKAQRTRARLEAITEEESQNIVREVGAERAAQGRFDEARALFLHGNAERVFGLAG